MSLYMMYVSRIFTQNNSQIRFYKHSLFLSILNLKVSYINYYKYFILINKTDKNQFQHMTKYIREGRLHVFLQEFNTVLLNWKYLS